MTKLCDENCNECSLMLKPNARILTKIFNQAYNKFGTEFYKIVQTLCPNLTCCYDCHIDDFCHDDDSCELSK